MPRAENPAWEQHTRAVGKQLRRLKKRLKTCFKTGRFFKIILKDLRILERARASVRWWWYRNAALMAALLPSCQVVL